MKNTLWVCAIVVFIGCTTKQYYTPPQEPIPAPAVVNGVQISVEDARPELERHPFTGPVCLYHPSRVKPSPWEMLIAETESVVSAMSQKPERVVIVVTSLLLVLKDDTTEKKSDHNIKPAPTSAAKTGTSGEGDAKSAVQDATGSGTTNEEQFSKLLNSHPAGASCSVKATVRFLYAGGQEKKIEVDRLATGANLSGTKYMGEALEISVKGMVRQYGIQVRESLGIDRRR